MQTCVVTFAQILKHVLADITSLSHIMPKVFSVSGKAISAYVFLLQIEQMVLNIKYGVGRAGDDNQIRVGVVAPRELDVNLEIVHDFADVAAARADQSRMNTGIYRHLLPDQLVQLVDNLHDVLFCLVHVFLVPGYRYSLLFRIACNKNLRYNFLCICN